MAQMVKNLPAKRESRVGKIPWRRNGNSLQDSCLENSMDTGTWWATVHEVAKSWTQLSDYTFTLKIEAPQLVSSPENWDNPCLSFPLRGAVGRVTWEDALCTGV